jgi:hypothetical protein
MACLPASPIANRWSERKTLGFTSAHYIDVTPVTPNAEKIVAPAKKAVRG